MQRKILPEDTHITDGRVALKQPVPKKARRRMHDRIGQGQPGHPRIDRPDKPGRAGDHAEDVQRNISRMLMLGAEVLAVEFGKAGPRFRRRKWRRIGDRSGGHFVEAFTGGGTANKRTITHILQLAFEAQ